MKKILLSSIAFFAMAICTIAQDASQWGVKLSGYVKADYIYDSRQGESAREHQFYLYPSPEKLSPDGVDLNEQATFNILAVQTRIKGSITGPDAFGAKTSAVIEADFLGHSNSDINGFRLRHAFVKLNWEHSELLMGQYWNPMFVPEVFPDLVNMNPGTPFKAFARNPQIRFSVKSGNTKIVLAAVTQRDHRSLGPDATGASISSAEFLQNAGVPDMHLQVQFGQTSSVFGGLTASYKTLVPRLTTQSKYAANTEKIQSLAAQAFISVRTSIITWKAEAHYGQNSTDNTMLGGYAVSVISNDERDNWEYTNLKNVAVWTDVMTNGKVLQVGAFAGFTKNLGANDNIVDTDHIYARGANIDYVHQISGRILWTSGKMKFAFEPSCTTVAYGTINPGNKALVENSNPISSLRLLGAVYYTF